MSSDAASPALNHPCNDIGVLFGLYAQIHENIKFADQKALALSAIDGAVLGWVLSGAEHWHSGAGRGVLAFATAGLLAAGVICAVVVLRPRGNQEDGPPGLVDVHRIAKYALADLETARREISADVFTSQVWEMVHHRSGVNAKKYWWLEQSLYLSGAGWLAGALLALIVTGF